MRRGDNTLINQQGATKMIFSSQQTRYKAQKENRNCFAFYKVEGGYMCFHCAQTLKQYKQQR